MRSFVLTGTYVYSPDRGEFIAAVCKQEGDELIVLTVGCEPTEAMAMTWLKDTIALMREHQSFEVQAPDMYERGGVVHDAMRAH